MEISVGITRFYWRSRCSLHNIAILLFTRAFMSDSTSLAIPSAQQYALALKQLDQDKKLNKSARLMLQCHYEAPDRTVSYSQLAKAADLEEAHLVYGTFCRALGEALAFPFRNSMKREAPYYGSVIGHDINKIPGQEFKLRMYAEVAAAIELLGWYQASVLADLRPITKSAVIDLVERAGINIEDWYVDEHNKPVPHPRSNPRYCYNWSFGTAREGFVLCVWHQQLKTSASAVIFDENLLEHGLHKQAAAQDHQDENIRRRAQAHARRSFAFAEACEMSYLKGSPLRVIINDGSKKEREDLDESSVVLQRELDSELWYVHRYDNKSGDCLIVRGVRPGQDKTDADDTDYAAESHADSLEADDKRRQIEIWVRQKQGPFREMLLTAYGRKCTVTGTRVVETLEAAHIIPHAEGANYRPENGLLLRADIHTLYDLYLLSIDERCRVHVSRTLRYTEYACLGGRTIHLPPVTHTPSFAALRRRHERFLEKELERP